MNKAKLETLNQITVKLDDVARWDDVREGARYVSSWDK